MSFLLLMMSMYAFGEVAEKSSESAKRAIYKDVASRTAAGVLELAEVARKRAETDAQAASRSYLISKILYIPPDINGLQYTVALETKQVRVSGADGRFEETSGTLNLATQGTQTTCSTTTFTVCHLGGTVNSGSGRIVIKYEYNLTPSTDCPTTAYEICIRIT